jgi:hypothetical protein
MNSDAILEAAKFGRADARAGLPMSRDFVLDPDDSSAEANAYRDNYSRTRAALAAARSNKEG